MEIDLWQDRGVSQDDPRSRPGPHLSALFENTDLEKTGVRPPPKS
jgi:hypothetical protein